MRYGRIEWHVFAALVALVGMVSPSHAQIPLGDPLETLVLPAQPPAQPVATDYVLEGENAFKTGRYGDALRHWQHALVDSPASGGLHLLVGQALFALGRFDEELAATRRGFELLPNDKWGEVVRNYTELYRGNQDYTDQLRSLEKERKAHDSPGVRFLLGYHYGYLGYSKEAVRELDVALELDPANELARKLRTVFAAKLPAK